MTRQRSDQRVIAFPKYRRFAAVAGRSMVGMPLIHGLIEVDVTKARAALRAHKAATGESVSFTAFLAACLARAVAEHPEVQALRRGARHLALFADVDVAVRIERDVAGTKVVVPYILRAANRKTVRALHDEIRAAQTAATRDVTARYRAMAFLPTALYSAFVWALVRLRTWRPRLWKGAMGTVGLTSVGMFGDGAGWGIPAASPTSLMVTAGGIGAKPAVAGGLVAVRELLSLTISVDHDVVDGGPAARFAQRLKTLIESGYGLEDLAAAPERAGATADGAR